MRRVFYSFHYERDAWRVNQVRNMGVVDGNPPASPNKWEEIKRAGENAIKRWIQEQMSGRSCVVVLIGRETANRPWVLYEIAYGWNREMGVVGVYVHNLKDKDGRTDLMGPNPFDRLAFTLSSGKKVPMSQIVRAYDPPADDAYGYIRSNLAGWIEEAIKIRENFKYLSF